MESCGLSADLNGNLRVKPGLCPWATDAVVENIACGGKTHRLSNGELALEGP